jgi:hypothetical protein
VTIVAAEGEVLLIIYETVLGLALVAVHDSVAVVVVTLEDVNPLGCAARVLND